MVSVCCVVTRASPTPMLSSRQGSAYRRTARLNTIVRRLQIASVLLIALTLRLASQAQPPVFRGGTNLVQVDAIVTDSDGRPLTDLTAADFEVFDDGKPVTIDRV